MTADATLQSGSGAITVASITDGLGSYTLTLHEDVAGSTGTVTFSGNVTVNDLDTVVRAYDVAFGGAANTITTDTTFINTTTVTIGNDATDVTTFTGGLDTTGAAATNIAGTVATVNQQMDLGPTTMTANATLQSGSGPINVATITDGLNSYTLTLHEDVAGSTGTVTFSGNVAVNDLDTVARAYAVAFQGAANTIDTDTR